MGTFDPQSFLDANFQGANDTKLIPVPEGEYNALLGDVDIATWQSRDGSKNGIKLTMNATIDDQRVREVVGRDTVRVKYDVMLDTNEGGGLDMGAGKNINLGRLREATNLNDPAKPFNFRQFEGKMVKVRIGHRTDGENIYNDIKGVTRAS